ncbi:MAG: ABC transporter ATP-binding protein [Dorea sp.]|jgi:ABC-type multidrug transport system, ATPase component|uniref:ATP-binding cassette domain-containing protein n=1 Tax=Sporofaciens musculi TaxID=2681861 RepID=UPI002171B136|nr:ABC transporter ATP-binding protein [Sporofaciens musculi]MCI9423325.1 ABC transporter ATP-binding protein [Dorea sp.]
MSRIEVKDVSKSFKDTQALSCVNLCFEENTIYGLLGRNGAGKSTLLNIINNRLFADSGRVTLDNKSLTENTDALSSCFLANESNLYPEGMKVSQALKWSQEFYPDFDREYAKKLCESFKLPVKKKIKDLSTGYRSIFQNIVALSVNVPFVFLDEPVLGLDACHRDLFYRTLIEKYSEQPFTAVISTHLIEEAAKLIEHVVVIKNGEIIRNEPLEDLLGSGYCISGPGAQIDAYVEGKEVIGMDTLGGLKTAYVIGTPDSRLPSGTEASRMDLQKLFIRLTDGA